MSNETQSATPLADDGYCFGCGPNNPIGLKLEFDWNSETGDYVTTYTPTREHQGWVGRIHGGLIGLVFDEVLSQVGDGGTDDAYGPPGTDRSADAFSRAYRPRTVAAHDLRRRGR